MHERNHVHIISAGERTHLSYPAAFRVLPTITTTWVLADATIYERSKNPEVEKERAAVRNAVTAAGELSASLSIPFSREIVFPPTDSSVSTLLAAIHRKNPGARYTFDLCGGSKPLCMALLASSIWLEGEVYVSFGGFTARPVPLPGRPVRSLMNNPNYHTILALLLRRRMTDPDTPVAGWETRRYLFGQLVSFYVRSRKRVLRQGNPQVPDITVRKGCRPAAGLTHSTFSGYMKILRGCGLIYEDTPATNRKERIYRISDRGEMAFRFFSSPDTNTLVQSVFENVTAGTGT